MKTRSFRSTMDRKHLSGEQEPNMALATEQSRSDQGRVAVVAGGAGASKGALIGIMRTLAVGLGPDGIAVSAVAPGLIDTPGSRTVNPESDFDAVVARQALKRRLTPEDTAASVAFLASEAGAVMTGQVLCADGGLIFR
jgi:NAD(P)-dependent dehydrogenase (short-subunit alcohol dehydrogenase family)